MYQDTLTTQSKCPKCGYTHSHNNCPAYGKECFNCNGLNYFIALCKKPWEPDPPGEQSQIPHKAREVPEAQQQAQTKLFIQQE